jgi:small-conductance mechanosensitive channel
MQAQLKTSKDKEAKLARITEKLQSLRDSNRNVERQLGTLKEAHRKVTAQNLKDALAWRKSQHKTVLAAEDLQMYMSVLGVMESEKRDYLAERGFTETEIDGQVATFRAEQLIIHKA